MHVSGSPSITRSVRPSANRVTVITRLQGLGTSKDTDARDYFSNMKKHTIAFSTTQAGDKELIELAFSKTKADDRKEWLRQFRVFRLLGYSCLLLIHSASPVPISTTTPMKSLSPTSSIRNLSFSRWRTMFVPFRPCATV